MTHFSTYAVLVASVFLRDEVANIHVELRLRYYTDDVVQTRRRGSCASWFGSLVAWLQVCSHFYWHTLRQLYAAKAVNISWEVAHDAFFVGDREDLLEMLGNLLDNACKWCTKRVSLTITANETLSFVMEDDGPGCPVLELSALTLRGYKGDQSSLGSGLGLAIVNNIADSFDGILSFDRSAALGGLRVEVSLHRQA
jgi:signal transduction histidine kinase